VKVCRKQRGGEKQQEPVEVCTTSFCGRHCEPRRQRRSRGYSWQPHHSTATILTHLTCSPRCSSSTEQARSRHLAVSYVQDAWLCRRKMNRVACADSTKTLAASPHFIHRKS